MPRYSALPNSPAQPTTSPRRSLSFRLHSRRQSQVPDPDEMNAAFDGPDVDDADDAQEDHHLLGGSTGHQQPDASSSSARGPAMPGDYDFDRDYFLPPPGSPPPFEPYSATNPAPGNNNGIIPTEPVARPKPRHFLGGLLPSSILPRHGHDSQPVGGGQSGVFSNLSARPDDRRSGNNGDNNNYAAEEESKEAPPSYQTALRDAVPPYWDTTVVLPSSDSPFGPLSSSMNGDEILIDGMGAGNFFSFFWNMIVSAAFQYIGFLLTYVLHTTHSAKFGSRAGLGITLVQTAFTLRAKAQEDLDSIGHLELDPVTHKAQGDLDAEAFIAANYGKLMWPQTFTLPEAWGHNLTYSFNSLEEVEQVVHQFNGTLADVVPGLSLADQARANYWLSFMVMTIGWFLILAAIGGWWRVKRFEHKILEAKRESEAAQAVARGEVDPDSIEVSTTPAAPGPFQRAYYTNAFSQWANGAREIQRGFFGHRGRPVGTDRGDTLFDAGEGDQEHNELLEAQGYGLTPMATDSTRPAGGRTAPRGGLWS